MSTHILYDFLPHYPACASILLNIFFLPINYKRWPLYKIPSNLLTILLPAEPIAFSLSRNTEVTAIACKAGNIYTVDLSNNTVYTYKENAVIALAWSPKERVLASGTDDGHMTIRTIQGDTLLSIKVSSNPVNAIAWKPDGTQIAVAHGSEISVFQIK